MKEMWEEFKGFLNKGDFVTIAVGLVMALYFKAIVDGLLNGIVYPLIAAIFRKPDLKGIGFDIGQARFSIGLVIDALISFLVVSFILFLLLKGYNKMMVTAKERIAAKKAADEAAGIVEEEEAVETELSVLREIRDAMHVQREPA